MLAAQALGKDSLRDLSASLSAHRERFYHLGAKLAPRSTLSDANNRRPWEVFHHLYLGLLDRCRSLAPAHRFNFNNPLFSIDSTVIGLCLSVFPWAKYQKRKGAIKMHCRLDHSGMLPDLVVVTDGKKHDLRVASELTNDLKPDSIVSFDRGYIDFKWLFSLTIRRVFFVTRAKYSLDYSVVGQHNVPEQCDSKREVLADELLVFNSIKTSRDYPQKIRRVKFRDHERNKTLVFLTNNFDLPPATIAAIYKARWQIEILFKWIKQNLKIKSFMGTTENAVRLQIWIAMIYFMLLAYIKFQSRYKYSLHTLTEIVQATLFHRISLIDILNLKVNSVHKIKPDPETQFSLHLNL